jgi:hypothetical protein
MAAVRTRSVYRFYVKANGHLSASEPIALHCPSSALDRICVNARGRPHRSLGLGPLRKAVARR